MHWRRNWSAEGTDAAATADDSNIDVRSRRAGERGMARIRRCLPHRLQRKGQAQKSAVDCPQNRSFLGCSVTGGRLLVDGKWPPRPSTGAKRVSKR